MLEIIHRIRVSVCDREIDSFCQYSLCDCDGRRQSDSAVNYSTAHRALLATAVRARVSEAHTTYYSRTSFSLYGKQLGRASSRCIGTQGLCVYVCTIGADSTSLSFISLSVCSVSALRVCVRVEESCLNYTSVRRLCLRSDYYRQGGVCYVQTSSVLSQPKQMKTSQHKRDSSPRNFNLHIIYSPSSGSK